MPTQTTFSAGEVVTYSKLNTAVLLEVPNGGIIPYAGSSAPTGWLLCDGTAVNRATYANLFSVIGTVYGAGDGSTTFNLPDLRGRMVVGVGTHTDVDAVGDSDGLSVSARRPSHKHTVNDPGHHHTIPVTTGTGAGAVAGDAFSSPDVTGDSYTGITVGPQTGSEPTDTPAYMALNYIIRY